MSLALKILNEETPKEFFKRRNIGGQFIVKKHSDRRYNIHQVPDKVGFMPVAAVVATRPDGHWGFYFYGGGNDVLYCGERVTAAEAISAALAVCRKPQIYDLF